ncbi:hypothetical protein vBPaeMUSP18_06 [Pseudomonas phage vB_PaeM_USP_18]|nr:hypothetical protein vBPaeMUSP18_06 [Pseudomonas phage vB_PaeM_USP_18]QLI49525.1 hypothetical protein vBPaeMUSP25_06 [Pseudomonas phage vB_PaeM_USP_25]
MTLPFDKARCSGRMDFHPEGPACEHRDTCARYLAFTQWDRKSAKGNYRGALVVMAVRDCKNKIEAPESARGKE